MQKIDAEELSKLDPIDQKVLGWLMEHKKSTALCWIQYICQEYKNRGNRTGCWTATQGRWNLEWTQLDFQFIDDGILGVDNLFHNTDQFPFSCSCCWIFFRRLLRQYMSMPTMTPVNKDHKGTRRGKSICENHWSLYSTSFTEEDFQQKNVCRRRSHALVHHLW